MNNNEIYKIYGTEYKNMTIRLLKEADLGSLLAAKARECNYENQYKLRIGIKPNLVSPTPADYGATTHPEVVAGIIEYIRLLGYDNICIMEGCWIGDKTSDAFEYCGYNSLAQQTDVRLIDMQLSSSHEIDADGMLLNVCEEVNNIDFLINVPVLKGHCQTKITCALKNMKGLIPNSEKRRFHAMGLHDPIAHLNRYVKQDFIVVDHICGDLDFEGGGNPHVSNCVMAAIDPVLTDAYVCSLLGYKVRDVDYIMESAKMGVGSADLNNLKTVTVGDGEFGLEKCPEETLPQLHKVLELSYHAEELDTCSACYEALMEALDRLEEENLLEMLKTKICIGQGYRGRTGEFGVGNCTRLFRHTVSGCPPTADDIYDAVKNLINR